MVKLQELRPALNSRKSRKRVGRGSGSGHGKTSGKGQKGQKARSGGGKGLGFEGGQNPLAKRIPKLPGFKNPFKKEFAIVNLDNLNIFKEGAIVDSQRLLEKGLVRKGLPVKVLARGEVKKSLKVRAQAFSKEAIRKIEGAGGKVEVI